jgi:hypothetical protein
MATFVHLQILPGQPHPLIALTPSRAQVPAVLAIPFAPPPAAPADGPTLWQALPEAVRRSLRQLYSLQPDPLITLWLDVQVPEVMNWPWELLAPDERPALPPFACTPRTPLARAYPTTHVLPVRRPGALHLLAITATPRDQPPADPQPALQHLRRLDPARVVVEIRERLPATALRETLMQLQPDLLLFIGHGTPEAIVFEDEQGDSHRLNGPELAAALAGTLVRAVVLASCSGATPYADGRSIATALLDGGALAVVAMRGPVAAESADAFLHGLLDSLARSQPVEVAAAEGRSQMIAALGAQEGDWMLPVCWQRAPGCLLVVPMDAALTQGAQTLAAKAPSLAGALASGGLLGLLAVCTLQSLFLPQTLAVPAIVKLLEGLGLNVLAGYLGEALKDVWRRTNSPEVERAEVAKTIRRIAWDEEDAVVEIARVARMSGALQATLEAINARIAGSDALLQGLRCDVERHTAVLEVLQIELREVKQGVLEIRRVVEATMRTTDAIRDDTAAMCPQISAIHEQVTADANQRRAREEMLLRDYLSTVSQDCNRLSLADYDSSDPNKLAVDLDSVYVRLEVARTVEREPRQLTALEALAQQPRLVLLGAPGSGKSTFVNFLARCLALATLEDQPRWLERLGAEWSHGPLVPIQITLRKFAAWVAEQDPPIDHGDAGLPWRFLAATQSDELAACLRRLAHDGRALLLFDGLDEVAADERDWPLMPIRESIAALARGLAHGSRALVTCRVLDYQWQPRRLAHWPDDTIAPLSEPLQEQFIHNWYAVLERLRRPLLDTAAVLEQRLARGARTPRAAAAGRQPAVADYDGVGPVVQRAPAGGACAPLRRVYRVPAAPLAGAPRGALAARSPGSAAVERDKSVRTAGVARACNPSARNQPRRRARRRSALQAADRYRAELFRGLRQAQLRARRAVRRLYQPGQQRHPPGG